MTAVNDIWRGMVQRRLWPIALLLVLALAAVPFLLAKSPDTVAPTPVASAPTASSGPLDTKPIVAVAADASRVNGRVVLGARKDPFRPAIKGKKGKAPATTTSKSSATAPSGGSANTPGSSGGSTPTGTITPGGLQVTPTHRKSYELYSIAVRFGDSAATELKVRSLRRLKALPSVSEPLLVYLGVLGDGKTAVFMVDSSVIAQGDGSCKPSPQNCQTIHLKPGDTEFFDVTSPEGGSTQQFQLDLVKIRRNATTSAKAARHAYSATAAGGRAVVRANLARIGRYQYDAKTGRLHKVSAKAWKGQAAKATAAAAAASAR